MFSVTNIMLALCVLLLVRISIDMIKTSDYLRKIAENSEKK
jgi:hypothetical protein